MFWKKGKKNIHYILPEPMIQFAVKLMLLNVFVKVNVCVHKSSDWTHFGTVRMSHKWVGSMSWKPTWFFWEGQNTKSLRSTVLDQCRVGREHGEGKVYDRQHRSLSSEEATTHTQTTEWLSASPKNDIQYIRSHDPHSVTATTEPDLHCTVTVWLGKGKHCGLD